MGIAKYLIWERPKSKTYNAAWSIGHVLAAHSNFSNNSAKSLKKEQLLIGVLERFPSTRNSNASIASVEVPGGSQNNRRSCF